MTNETTSLTSLLRTPGLTAFIGGRFLAAGAIWTERLTFGWLVWQATQSAAWVGAIAAIRLAPALVLGPLGGALADRAGSVRLLRASHGGNALILAAMAPFATVLPFWMLITIVLAVGVLQGISAAPIKAVLPQIVRRDQLAAAVPLSSASFQLAGFAGPMVAGIALASVGAWLALVAAALGHFTFALVLARWNDDSTKDERGPAEPLWSGLVDATKHCLRDPVLAPIFYLHFTAALLLRPLLDLMPVIASALAPGDPAKLGLLTAAVGAGALSGAVWMTLSSALTAQVRRITFGSVAASLALLALAFALHLAVVAVVVGILFAFGLLLIIRGTASLTMVQLSAAPAMRGRALGLFSTVLRGFTALGAVIIGAATEFAGLEIALSLCALIGLGVALTLLRRLNEIPTPTT